ncbi:MFS transporter [Alkalihalobacillus sp. MEB130]|uniref:MFS transporter n=1 Tax=Alkalihalobacillus sp. MEB130 TaxID=2976704 RepID=UPI0028E02BE6|nr:MFS transporter [Alkalihalobacillus sp. MEB130]MDT8860216.1 MFS transporter [Alkalihalobacillus sp. MEB130]
MSTNAINQNKMEVEVVKNEEVKLSTGTKISYGLGDLASQFVWTFIGSYLLLFYTDVVGLAPAVVAVLMLVSRIWDGINDPMLGILADRTKSKHGRFRPYILYGTPFLAIFSVLVFTAPSFGGNTIAQIAWATFTYIMLGMLYTVVNLPYGSLGAVMTKDPEERQAVSSYRMVGKQLGGVTLSFISMPIILFFSQSDQPTAYGFTMTALIFASLAVPLFYLVFFKCKEVVTPINPNKVPVKQSLKMIVSSKPLMCIFFIMLLTMTAFFGRMGTVIYYYMYVVQRMELVAIFMPLPFIATAIGIILFSRFATKVGKKNMLYISYSSALASLVFLYFVDFSNIPLLLVGTFWYGLSLFGFPILIAMVPDAIDHMEHKKGIRVDGAANAAISLSTKFGSAISGSGALVLLAVFGYVANTEQTAEAINGINMVVNLMPALLFGLAMIIVKFYGLTEQRATEVRLSLAKKRIQSGNIVS